MMSREVADLYLPSVNDNDVLVTSDFTNSTKVIPRTWVQCGPRALSCIFDKRGLMKNSAPWYKKNGGGNERCSNGRMNDADSVQQCSN